MVRHSPWRGPETAFETACIPVVISTIPKRRAFQKGENQGIFWIKAARMENSIIYPPMRTITSKELIITVSKELFVDFGKGVLSFASWTP